MKEWRKQSRAYGWSWRPTSYRLRLFLVDAVGDPEGVWQGRMPVRAQRALFRDRVFGRGTIVVDGARQRVTHAYMHSQAQSRRREEPRFPFLAEDPLTVDIHWRDI